MDKKNTVIGVLLLVAAFASLYFGSRLFPSAKPAPVTPEAARPALPSGPTALEPATSPVAAPATPAASAASAPAPAPSETPLASVATENVHATITTLANDYLAVHLSDFGGAIDDVAFKQYGAEAGRPEPYVFNQAHVDPILAFTEGSADGLDRNTPFQRVSATPTEVVYRAVIDGRIEITRRYSLETAPDPRRDPGVYLVRHETTFHNRSNQPLPAARVALSLGTASLVSANDYGQYLNVATYNGASAEVIDRGALEGAGVIGRMFGRSPDPKTFVETPGPVVWGAVKNQFFASIYAAAQPGIAVITRRVDLPPIPGARLANIGLTGAERFDLPALAPGATATLAGELYLGPKEYRRLSLLPQHQDKVMQYDRYFFSRMFLSGYVAPFMNTLMNWTHRWVYNWGFAIVLMTLILKIVTLPFTLAASRSAKRMQKFQPEIQALREKFKDNPQKLNQATLELFKEHKINPMGGCLPLLITMPLFFGFFTMLQGSAELRFQSFLWAHDLSAPDTVGHFLGFPINILPLIMTATMVYQMRLTPQPTVDNAQARMMKFMPVIFTFICYGYSCALSLYMTINGVFTIGQQLVINRMKDVATDAPAVGPGGKPVPKNVTPPRKKGRK